MGDFHYAYAGRSLRYVARGERWRRPPCSRAVGTYGYIVLLTLSSAELVPSISDVDTVRRERTFGQLRLRARGRRSLAIATTAHRERKALPRRAGRAAVEAR